MYICDFVDVHVYTDQAQLTEDWEGIDSSYHPSQSIKYQGTNVSDTCTPTVIVIDSDSENVEQQKSVLADAKEDGMKGVSDNLSTLDVDGPIVDRQDMEIVEAVDSVKNIEGVDNVENDVNGAGDERDSDVEILDKRNEEEEKKEEEENDPTPIDGDTPPGFNDRRFKKQMGGICPVY